MDLQSRLERFGGPIQPPTAAHIAGDLDRGRRAVRRRRTALTVAGSVAGVAALAAALAFGGGPVTTPDRTPPAAASYGGLTLVAYQGPQPKHFVIDKVPAGYFVQADDYGGLTIAPDRVRHPSPGVDPSKDPMYDPLDLQGKIAVYVEQQAYHADVSGEPVTVGGFPAILHTVDTTRQLLIKVSPTVFATIQVDVPLTRDQILELGAGLHVSQEAIDRAANATSSKHD
ncbi:hypothetical protein [Dactylosporangium matsuzakiense]|uniref:hypothetical protein n=1 Tax=Dactylosporangium matsuzakiense TaxID=53360 RepID=UPI0022F30CBA|nr:hypothetical protein [Dactylosporangium matsuzakiense]